MWVSECKVARGTARYLQIPKDDYISKFSLGEPLYALLLEAIDLEIVSHNTLFHAGRVGNDEITAPLCYDGKR